MSHFLIEDNVATLLNQGWEMATIGPSRVLVAEVHGSQCDGIGPTQCFVASVWDAEEKIWRSAERRVGVEMFNGCKQIIYGLWILPTALSLAGCVETAPEIAISEPDPDLVFRPRLSWPSR